MKLPSLSGGVITIKSDQKAAKKCYENNRKAKRGVRVVAAQPQVVEEADRVEAAMDKQPEPAGEVEEREIGEDV